MKLKTIDDFLSLVLSFVCLSFCLFALPILLYYIRMKYRLYLKIKSIPLDKLVFENNKNDLKNLKLKSMIVNFIIILILIEIANNGSILIDRIVDLSHGNDQIWTILNHVRFISKYSFIPMLCMTMDVLWLAYLNWNYKYTIMRWTLYIILRIISMNILYQLIRYYFENSTAEYEIVRSLNRVLLMIFGIIDLICYIWYSRRFYQHLKSRENEAMVQLSRRYLEMKFICKHFKIATILVAIPLTIYNVINVISIFFCCYLILFYFGLIDYSQRMYYAHFLIVWPIIFCQLLYRILFNFNYIYFIVLQVYKYWKQKRNINKVNKEVHQIVKKYHDKIYRVV